MNDDIRRLMAEPTVDIALAGRVLGIGKNAAYRAREAGEIPSIKIGGQYRVPSARLRDMLGLLSGTDPAPAVAPARS